MADTAETLARSNCLIWPTPQATVVKEATDVAHLLPAEIERAAEHELHACNMVSEQQQPLGARH